MLNDSKVGAYPMTDSMTASSDACLAMDDERFPEDEVVVSLTVRELASLLTHADRSFTASYSPNLMEVVPWNKWLRFVMQLARERNLITDVVNPDDAKVGQVYRRRGERCWCSGPRADAPCSCPCSCPSDTRTGAGASPCA